MNNSEIVVATSELDRSWPDFIIGGWAERDSFVRGLQTSIFFGDLNGVVCLDAKVANGAFDLDVAQEELHGPQIARSSIDQRGFGPKYGMRAELQWIETNAGNPFAD